MDAFEMAPGTTGDPGAWRGVLRHKRTVLWTCPHSHRNRDLSSMHEHRARDCAIIARNILAGLTTVPGSPTSKAQENWQSFVRSLMDSLGQAQLIPPPQT